MAARSAPPCSTSFVSWWQQRVTLGSDELEKGNFSVRRGQTGQSSPGDTSFRFNTFPSRKTTAQYNTTVSRSFGELLGGTATVGVDYTELRQHERVRSQPDESRHVCPHVNYEG